MAKTDSRSSLGFLMNDVTRLLRRSFHNRARALGLNQSQWRTLAQLSRNQGINQTTLAERLEIRPISLTQTIDRLEEMALVARRPDPADRRAHRLYLTEQAKPVLAELARVGAATREEAMAGLPPAARAQLLEALQIIKRNLLDAETTPGAVLTEGGVDERRAAG